MFDANSHETHATLGVFSAAIVRATNDIPTSFADAFSQLGWAAAIAVSGWISVKVISVLWQKLVSSSWVPFRSSRGLLVRKPTPDEKDVPGSSGEDQPDQ